MEDIQKSSFIDIFDTMQVIGQAIRKDQGEDCFYCAMSEQSAVVSVCDGCGGLGARKYDSFAGHTGAYIASRIVSGALHDWYHQNYRECWSDPLQLATSMDKYIRQAYKVCEPYVVEKLNIKGSMIRKLPTTLALAYAEQDRDVIRIHILWAGDSRVYMLDSNGLAQLSKDDTDVEDALENLTCDGVMTNVLSADGKYNINYRTISLNHPAIIFAATDGCFGYIPSPMKFEHVIVRSLVDSNSPEAFKAELRNQFVDYAGDDFSFGMMSFGYGSYENTRRAYIDRLNYLEHVYKDAYDEDCDNECIQCLWKDYKQVYERYL